MKVNLSRNLLYNLISITKKQGKGFTMVELVVVMLIASSLAIIAFPHFTTQVGKSREAETKLIMGTIARQQQAYHFEKQTFASDLNLLNIGMRQQYHNINVATTVSNSNMVKHPIIAIDPLTSGVRNFAIGVYFNNAVFATTLCQSFEVNQPVNVGNAPADDCTNNGTKLN